jgi:thiamine-phosphate pyrophosphorylase
VGRFSNIGFYGILTEPRVGYERLTRIMVDQAVRVIQLRMKDTPRPQVLRTALSLRKIIPAGVSFIINDDPHVAREVGADGVHLGQQDMPFAEARQILGPDLMIGLSTHNPDQTRAACSLKPDYVGVGPVFATPTKRKPDPVIGLDGLRAMLALADVPAVALGGIDHENLEQVLAAGALNVCAVRCINRSLDPAVDLDRILKTIEASREQ